MSQQEPMSSRYRAMADQQRHRAKQAISTELAWEHRQNAAYFDKLARAAHRAERKTNESE